VFIGVSRAISAPGNNIHILKIIMSKVKNERRVVNIILGKCKVSARICVKKNLKNASKTLTTFLDITHYFLLTIVKRVAVETKSARTVAGPILARIC
jgi:hypothetical protein